MRLNLGCGRDILPGWTNVDAHPISPEVMGWDLAETPWPWATGTAEEIRGIDVFEHIEPKHRVAFVVECHRVLAPGGILRLQTAYYTSIDAYSDPTHYTPSTEYSFDFWIPGTIHYEAKNPMYGGIAFDRIKTALNHQTGQLDVILRKPNA